MTSDRRSYTERVTDAGAVLAELPLSGATNTGQTALLAAGLPGLLDEVDRLGKALDEANAQIDGRAWEALEADRDRYRDALAELLAGIAASPRPDQRNWVEARVYLPDLDDAREMMRGAS